MTTWRPRFSAPPPPPAMATKRKKGLSVDEKRAVMLGLCHDTKEVFNLKELESKGAKLGVNYSDDYFGESGKFTYVYATYAGEVYKGFGVVAAVGLNSLDGTAEQQYITGSSSTDDSYVDYKLGVSKSFEGIGFELAYIGTDIKRSEQGAARLGESLAVLTATKTF